MGKLILLCVCLFGVLKIKFCYLWFKLYQNKSLYELFNKDRKIWRKKYKNINILVWVLLIFFIVLSVVFNVFIFDPNSLLRGGSFLTILIIVGLIKAILLYKDCRYCIDSPVFKIWQTDRSLSAKFYSYAECLMLVIIGIFFILLTLL